MSTTYRIPSVNVCWVALLALAGCGAPGASDSQKSSANMYYESAAKSSVASAVASPSQPADEQPLNLTQIADSQPDRYLIKNAKLTLEAADVRKITERLIGDAKRIKGYVSEMHEAVDALGTRSVSFVARVPSTEFDTYLHAFEAQGKLINREVTAEDVTEEFVDTQSRLHNLRATETRLLAHLNKTGRLSDTLLIEKEINRVRDECERLTGRLKFLSHRIAFSTFTVTVQETPHVQSITPTESFSAGKVVSDSARSLLGFGQQVLTFAIWLTMWSVVWLPAVLIGVSIWWRYRRSAPRMV